MKTIFTKHADFSSIPEELRGPLVRYIDEGLNPGCWLCHIIVSDIYAAALNAPLSHRPAIGHVAVFLLQHAPADCYGNVRALQRWLDTGGAIGNGHGLPARR